MILTKKKVFCAEIISCFLFYYKQSNPTTNWMGSTGWRSVPHRWRGMQRCWAWVSWHLFEQHLKIKRGRRLTHLIFSSIFSFTEDTFHFKGTSVDSQKHYEVTINFLHKINPDKIAAKNTTRCIEFVIVKAAPGPYWTSLTNDKKKPHFIKADFNKWKDEDDEEDGEFTQHNK